MSLVDTIAGHPAVYNLLQDLAGRRAIFRRIQPWLDQLSGCVLDIGGGTGRIVELLPAAARYVCLDHDAHKLGSSRGPRRASGLVADAAALPFASGTIDCALLIAVTHHLDEDGLRKVLSEIGRVLRPSGRFIMLDAVHAPNRFTSRALWSWDRGNHPRTWEVLGATLGKFFDVEETTNFEVLHNYYAMNCRAPLQATDRSKFAHSLPLKSAPSGTVGTTGTSLPHPPAAMEFE